MALFCLWLAITSANGGEGPWHFALRSVACNPSPWTKNSSKAQRVNKVYIRFKIEFNPFFDSPPSRLTLVVSQALRLERQRALPLFQSLFCPKGALRWANLTCVPNSPAPGRVETRSPISPSTHHRNTMKTAFGVLLAVASVLGSHAALRGANEGKLVGVSSSAVQQKASTRQRHTLGHSECLPLTEWVSPQR